jgi:hypothetical protein
MIGCERPRREEGEEVGDRMKISNFRRRRNDDESTYRGGIKEQRAKMKGRQGRREFMEADVGRGISLQVYWGRVQFRIQVAGSI